MGAGLGDETGISLKQDKSLNERSLALMIPGQGRGNLFWDILDMGRVPWSGVNPEARDLIGDW